MSKKKISAFLSAVLLLASGCSGTDGSEDGLPEDTPYNHQGSLSIMETKQGFYTNVPEFLNYGINIKFIEKSSGKQVYLCAKPECMHDGGEMCTATYKNLYSINSVLYDGAVYTLVIEDINGALSFSIYRSALDGSSLTRVGSAFSANNIKEENYGFRSSESFIIHKGYAYVPYHLSFGGAEGFAGGGLARMNLSDGNSEILYSSESYYEPTPQCLQGSGDYVYYNIFDKGRNEGFYAYCITDGTTERLDIDNERTFIAGERVFVTKSTVWGKIPGEIGVPHDIYIVNKETGVKTVLITSVEGQQRCDSPLPYRDMIIVTLDSGVYVYSETGELVSSVGTLSTEKYGSGCTTLISEDKLYLLEPNYVESGDSLFPVSYSYYSCPVEDILDGDGEWKLEYTYII